VGVLVAMAFLPSRAPKEQSVVTEAAPAAA